MPTPVSGTLEFSGYWLMAAPSAAPVSEKSPLATRLAGCSVVPAGQMPAAVTTVVLATPTASVSLALLLAGLGSFRAGGGVMDAVLITEPLPAVTCAFNSNVTEPPAGSVGICTPAWNVVVDRPPGQTAPPDDEQLMLSLDRPVAAGSVMVVPLAADGPGLTTLIW